MDSIVRQLSIHELSPLESGGVVARNGFNFQDHMAARFCLEMLKDQHLLQVWCESQDDITFIWEVDGHEEVEFVQVKGSEPDQLWTVAKLCERDNGKEGTSILERSFMYDRCHEPCRFRIVTTHPINKAQLGILLLPLANSNRQNAQTRLDTLLTAINKCLKGFLSPNGNTCLHWLNNTVWEHAGAMKALETGNQLTLQRLIEAGASFVTGIQSDGIYESLLWKVKAAADADSRLAPAAKKITRIDLAHWLNEQINRLVPTGVVGGTALAKKMQMAGLTTADIMTACEQREHYVAEWLTPRYLDTSNRILLQAEVYARLQLLRSELESGKLVDTGVEFHSRCLQELEEVRRAPCFDSPPPSSLLQGCMYTVTDRCAHRFTKVIP